MPVIQGDIYNDGYLLIRNFIQNTFKYISMVDSSDNEVMRLEIGVDPRAVWTHATGANPLMIQVTVKGSDVEVTEPCTLNKAYLYTAASGGAKLAGGLYTIFTIESGDVTSADDVVVLTFQFFMPALV